MNRFRYERARDAAHGFELLTSEPRAKWLAGGTNLLDLMKIGIEQPPLLVDVNAIVPSGIEIDDERVRIGAATRMSEVIADARVGAEFPMVVQALEAGASPQLRNMASIGGNLMQRTRCAYFRDPATPCNKRAPGTGCFAIGGLTRQHAVLGAGEHCINVHPSDLAVALVAADALVHVLSPDGERIIPIDEFYVLPGERPDIETVLRAAELIAAVSIPRNARSRRSLYAKVRDRASYEFALVSAAVALEMQSGRITEPRIALGGVAPKPWRALKAEEVLRGREASSELYMQAAEAELSSASGYGENDFKIELARRLIVRGLSKAAALP